MVAFVWLLYNIVYLNYLMNDYGSLSKSRPVLKSPNTHLTEDPKQLKKKYEQLKETLRAEKKNN